MIKLFLKIFTLLIIIFIFIGVSLAVGRSQLIVFGDNNKLELMNLNNIEDVIGLDSKSESGIHPDYFPHGLNLSVPGGGIVTFKKSLKKFNMKGYKRIMIGLDVVGFNDFKIRNDNAGIINEILNLDISDIVKELGGDSLVFLNKILSCQMHLYCEDRIDYQRNISTNGYYPRYKKLSDLKKEELAQAISTLDQHFFTQIKIDGLLWGQFQKEVEGMIQEKDGKTEIILFVIPYSPTFENYLSKTERINKQMLLFKQQLETFAKKNGRLHLVQGNDFQYCGLKDFDYDDLIHLNNEGAKKFSSCLKLRLTTFDGL